MKDVTANHSSAKALDGNDTANVIKVHKSMLYATEILTSKLCIDKAVVTTARQTTHFQYQVRHVIVNIHIPMIRTGR